MRPPVLSPLREHPYYTGKRLRKKGAPHTGVFQRPALTESCRTRAYRQASEHGTGSQSRQMGGIFHEMAYRCGSQRHERHGMSEPYLSGIDRGQAGTVQSWWLDNLCPTPLKNYLFTGKIDPQGKDILTLIAEYLFINIDDQLKELNKQNENALKNLITTPAVNTADRMMLHRGNTPTSPASWLR